MIASTDSLRYISSGGNQKILLAPSKKTSSPKKIPGNVLKINAINNLNAEYKCIVCFDVHEKSLQTMCCEKILCGSCYQKRRVNVEKCPFDGKEFRWRVVDDLQPVGRIANRQIERFISHFSDIEFEKINTEKSRIQNDALIQFSDAKTLTRLFKEAKAGIIPTVNAQEKEVINYDEMDLGLLRERVAQNDVRAIYELGLRNLEGDGVPQHNVIALNLFFIAYLHGLKDAVRGNLNMMLNARIGANNAIVKWLEELARQENEEAMYCLGLIYSKGCGVQQDSVKAEEYFHQAAEKDAKAVTRLFKQAKKGLIPTVKVQEQREDYEKMDLSLLRRRVDKNDVRAIHELGLRNLKGDGVPQDNVSALNLFYIAYLHGFQDDEDNINIMIDAGIGANNALVKWLEELEEQGNEEAMFCLGVMYSLGFCVEKDSYKAVEYYRQAAKKGDLASLFNLGASFYNGVGVERDYQESTEYFLQGAKKGDVNAMYHAGCAHHYGRGVIRNKENAKFWLEKAADQGSKPAKIILDQILQSEQPILTRLLAFWF